MSQVLISGASVAGLSLASWLRTAGHTVTVVERAPALREGGYAVDIRGVALDVARRMGIDGEARRLGTDTEGTGFVDRTGRRVATLPLGFGVLSPDDIEIMKGDLTRLLHAGVPAGVHWRFGTTVTALTDTPGGVDVTFSDRPPGRFDLVLGADGLHSGIRALAFGPAQRYTRHLGSNMAVFTAPNHLGLDRWQLIHNAPGRVASVKTDRGNATVKVSLLYGGDPPPRDRTAQLAAVTAAFAGCGWEVPRLLADMAAAEDFFFAPNAQVVMPAWSTGRVALVGDAAHCPSPLTGQGTGLALVGAYVLAGELHEAGDHRAAFARYEALMRPFAERNQRAALGPAKGFAPRTAREVWFRDVSIKMLPHLPWRDRIFAAMTREAKRASEALTLPAYGMERVGTPAG